MKTRKIVGWRMVLLGITEIIYALYQQAVMGQNIKALHIIIILSTFLIAFLWLNRSAKNHL